MLLKEIKLTVSMVTTCCDRAQLRARASTAVVAGLASGTGDYRCAVYSGVAGLASGTSDFDYAVLYACNFAKGLFGT